MEALLGLYGAVVLLALLWSVFARRDRLLAFDQQTPGLLRVGVETMAFSAAGVLLFALLHAVRAPAGVSGTSLLLIACAGAAWPGLRSSPGGGNAEQGTRNKAKGAGWYHAAQGVIASAFFAAPALAAAWGADLKGTRGAFDWTLLPLAMIALAWPLYLALAIAAAGFAANRRRRRMKLAAV